MELSYIGKLFVAGAMLCATFARAESGPEPLTEDVLLIEPDGTLVMAGGVQMILAGVVYPDYEAAVGKIADMLQGSQVQVTRVDHVPDRYGRMAGIFVRQDGQDVAEALLRSGLAVHWMRQGSTSVFQHYVEAEQAAREDVLGYWGQDAGRILCVDRDGGLTDRFIGQLRLVRGRVVAVGRAGGNVYLNFGDDWREDFTISLPQKREAELLEGTAENLLQKIVEVRGWLRSENGPLVELSVPHQIVDLSRLKREIGEASRGECTRL